MTINDCYAYLAEHLDEAIGHLLALRVALGVEDAPEPPDALDNALGADERAQEARRAVKRALDDLGEPEDREARQRAAYAVEEAVNGLVVAALDVGWKFGWSAGSGQR